jgi:radical SAM superfamily enzyme YgiQ (UPF0313 family)
MGQANRFEALEYRLSIRRQLPSGSKRKVRLPFESARGCWWGMRHHCTFCGLNGQTMAFRAKRPQRVLEELRDLARRYHSFKFMAVDNIIALFYHKPCVLLSFAIALTMIFYGIKIQPKSPANQASP